MFRRQESRINPHSNQYFLSNLLIYTICISGCGYQMINLSIHYFSYPTTVDIRLSGTRIFNLPAITFCLDRISILRNLSEIFKQLNGLKEKIWSGANLQIEKLQEFVADDKNFKEVMSQISISGKVSPLWFL